VIPNIAPTRRPVNPSSVKVTAAMLRITESPAGKLDTTRAPTDTTTCPPTSAWRRSAAFGHAPQHPLHRNGTDHPHRISS
jgi:hypothetical protein